jgi:hypothetical protein
MNHIDHLPSMVDRALGWAMPSARAGQASPRAVFHRLGHTVPISIAALNAAYFGGQLIRGLLS